MTFTDVGATHPYRTAILDGAAAGYISGYAGNTFRPSNPLYRAQFAKLIDGALGIPVTESTPYRFKDLGPDTASFYPHEYIGAATAKGIIWGYADNTFRPYNNVSRAQVITMVVRAGQNLKPGFLRDTPASYASSLGTFDTAHSPNVRMAEFSGLLRGLQGYGPSWNPWAPMSRGEVAQVLWNLVHHPKLDNTAPTVTVNQATGQPDPTNSTTVRFDVVFSESVTGVETGDFSLTGSTATGFSVVNVAGSGTTYQVTLSATTFTNGTVVLTMPAGGAQDAAGNTNTGSTSTDNTVTCDGTAGRDTQGPTVLNFYINGGDEAETTSTAVTLTSSVSDTSPSIQMRFSNDGTNWDTWTPYAESISWTLSGGDGAKTVYAQYRDSYGNESQTVNDSITLDTTPPTISAISPPNGHQNIAFNPTVTVTFAEAMDVSTINATNIKLYADLNNNQVVDDAGQAVTCLLTYSALTASVTPAAALSANTGYILSVTTGVRDLAGLSLAANQTSWFRTGAAADSTRPTVLSVSPANAATRVPVNTSVTITFSQSMLSESIDTESITVSKGGVSVPGRVELDPDLTKAYFYPDRQFDTNSLYMITATTGVKGLSGNALETDYTSSFTTGTREIGPHGGYSATSNLCHNCHAVHGAAVGGEQLLVETSQSLVCYQCHDGTGATTNVLDEFSRSSSGHLVDDSEVVPGPGLTRRCTSCHGSHDYPGSRPKLPRRSINNVDLAETGNNYTWCEACHNDSFDWVSSQAAYPYPSGETTSTKPLRDSTGYPIAGTYPGKTVYNNTSTNAHNPTTSTDVVWPGSGLASGDCRNCHASHGSPTRYDSLRDTFRSTPATATAQAVASDRQNGTYAALCFKCHDGSPATNILQFTSAEATTTGPANNGGHRIFTGGGNLPVGAPLPCYDCHNPHGSKGNDGSHPNKHLLSDEQWSDIDTSTPRGVVDFCLKCHLPSEYATASGQPEANTVPSGQLTSIEGLDRRDPANKLSLPNSVPEHGKSNMLSSTPVSCYDCHGNDYSAAGTNNVHNPSPGFPAGGTVGTTGAGG